MDRLHVRGTVDKLKGAVKDAVGRVSGNKKLQAEGKADKVKGTAQSAAGSVRDKSRRTGP